MELGCTQAGTEVSYERFAFHLEACQGATGTHVLKKLHTEHYTEVLNYLWCIPPLASSSNSGLVLNRSDYGSDWSGFWENHKPNRSWRFKEISNQTKPFEPLKSNRAKL